MLEVAWAQGLVEAVGLIARVIAHLGAMPCSHPSGLIQYVHGSSQMMLPTCLPIDVS